MADTRTRLIVTAAMLFRQKGYHGTGMAEILAGAVAPKGSLYHHFPHGKPDLALAAADWASDGMLRIIEDAFTTADSFREGATTLCHKLAKFFDVAGGWEGCPVSAILFDGPENDAFRTHATAIFDKWAAAVAAHAERLGENEPEDSTETLMIGLQGAWVMARARNSSAPLRSLPARIL